MTGLALHAQQTVFETVAFQIRIELPANVVRQDPALGCPLQIELGIVLFDKPIKKRLLRTVTARYSQKSSGLKIPGQVTTNTYNYQNSSIPWRSASPDKFDYWTPFRPKNAG